MIYARTKAIKKVEKLFGVFPIVGILGPRQCGKSTLAKQFNFPTYLDLENPRDLAKLDNPQLFLESAKSPIVIDEIQRKPDLFPLLRYLVDTQPDRKILVLGSASPNLIKQSSESLAGRIGYMYLKGFHLGEIDDMNRLWLQGGYPRAYLAENNDAAQEWLQNYISTFLERDIPQLGFSIPSGQLRKFWQMLAHYHGQVMNYSELGRSIGLSDMTIKKYLQILEDCFMIKTLQPWYTNTGKRIIKQPKIYFWDSGIYHCLMNITNQDNLLSTPKLGASWEGFALTNTLQLLNLPTQDYYFWSTHQGAEIDLFWFQDGQAFGMEFKYTDAPKSTKSMHSSIETLNLKKLFVVYPGKDKYELNEKIEVMPLSLLKEEFSVG